MVLINDLIASNIRSTRGYRWASMPMEYDDFVNHIPIMGVEHSEILGIRSSIIAIQWLKYMNSTELNIKY